MTRQMNNCCVCGLGRLHSNERYLNNANEGIMPDDYNHYISAAIKKKKLIV